VVPVTSCESAKYGLRGILKGVDRKFSRKGPTEKRPKNKDQRPNGKKTAK